MAKAVPCSVTRTTLETGWLYLEWGLGPEDAVILCGGYFVHSELGEKSDQFGVKRVKLRLYLVCSAGLGEHEEMLQKSTLLVPVAQRKECMFLLIQ